MNGRERILAMLGGQPVDHLPLMPITMMFAADAAGIPYQRYASNPDALVDAQIRTAERFGFDHVSAISDPAREVADLGGAIEWFPDQPPAIVESQAILASKARLTTLCIPDLDQPGRMNDRIRAIRSLRARAGEDLLVEGWVEGPCALGADLRGLNTLMLDFTDDPDFVTDLFDFAVRLETEFARAQIEAGADLIGIGDAAASLIGPRRYEAHVLPWQQRLISAIQSMGAKVRLHICGNTRKLLHAMGRTGADLIDLDYFSPLREARAVMGPRQTLLGNLDPVRVLRDGSPASITAALEQCWAEAQPCYIVGAGCEVPRGTPLDNLLALTRFAREHLPS
jgi:MtaA/CmuA family methyltransferase